MKVSRQALTLQQILGAKHHPAGPREMRYDRNIFARILDLGWKPYSDSLAGFVDYPVVLDVTEKSCAVLRGNGRIGTFQFILSTPLTDDKAWQVAGWPKLPTGMTKETAVKTVRDIVESGSLVVNVLSGVKDQSELMKLASDFDAKKALTRVQAFKMYQRFRQSGTSAQDACLAVGYNGRLMLFTWLEKVSPKLREAWIASENREVKPDGTMVPRIIDNQIRQASESIESGKGREDLGSKYAEIEKSILSGERKAVVKLGANQDDLIKAAIAFKGITKSFGQNDVAKLLRAVAGYSGIDKDGNGVASPPGYFGALVATMTTVEEVKTQPASGRSRKHK